MPIEFHCSECNRLVRTPDETAGKKGQCPQCGAVLQIPLASPAASPQGPSGGRASQASGVLEFHCTSCQKLVRVSTANAGQKGKCPHCSAVVQIPPQSAAAAGAGPASGAASQPPSPAGQGAPIQFYCPSCRRLVRTPPATAGKKGQCPHCGVVVQIPAASTVAHAASTSQAGIAPSSPPGGGPRDDLFADLPAAGGETPLGGGPFADLSAYEAAAPAAPEIPSQARRRRRRKPRKNYGPRDGLPWDRRGFEGKFFSTMSKVLFSPNEAFGVMRRTGGIGGPLSFVISGVLFGALVTVAYTAVALLILALVGIANAPEGASGSFGAVALGLGIFLAIFGVCVAAGSLIAAIVGSFLFAALHHLVLLLLDSADFGFETTYRVVAYCQGSMGVLQVVPCLGAFLPLIAYPVTAILGFCSAQETSGGRAAAAVLIPLALFAAFLVLPAILIFGWAFAWVIEAARSAAAQGPGM